MVSSNEFWRGSRRRNYVATFSVQFQFNDVGLLHGPSERFTQFTSLNSTGLEITRSVHCPKKETVGCNLHDLMPELVAPSTWTR
jgi:hypothetical protein